MIKGEKIEMKGRSYYRVHLGKGHKYAEECRKEGFVGVDFGMPDVSNEFCDNLREFNKKMVPIYLKERSDSSKVRAAVSCSVVWVLAQEMSAGDIVLSRREEGDYLIGEIAGGYSYHSGAVLPHRRSVKWRSKTISRDDITEELYSSAITPLSIINLGKYSEELERLVKGGKVNSLSFSDERVESPSYFAMENHLEDFMVCNWGQTILGEKYDIWEEDGEMLGQQFRTDTGPVDILAISKDKKEILVIELKKGRASDSVVGQIQRYMGYIKEEIAEDGQEVRGAIIALEDSLAIKRALSINERIDFYRYKVSFDLVK